MSPVDSPSLLVGWLRMAAWPSDTVLAIFIDVIAPPTSVTVIETGAEVMPALIEYPGKLLIPVLAVRVGLASTDVMLRFWRRNDSSKRK